MRFSADLLKLIVGEPFGQYIDRPEPQGLAVDGRTAALRSLRRYIAELTFYRKGAQGGPNIKFQIKPERFLIEVPDRPVDLQLPALAAVPAGIANYESLGIGSSFFDERTRDKYGKGTVIQRMAQYIEVFQLVVIAGARAERRSLMQGLETQLSPTEFFAGLKLRMPEYYNRIACFTLNTRSLLDSEESNEGRRLGQLGIELRFETVALTNYAELQAPQFPAVGDQIGPDVVIDKGK